MAMLLNATDLTMRFPGVLALDGVDFAIGHGEIVALLGQNGAGKSTLIQIVAGAHPTGAYTGGIELDGKPLRPRGISDAEAAGVALVPQEINILPDLTVAENIALNDKRTRWGLIDVGERLYRAKQVLENFDIGIDPAGEMSAHDLATQQLVVIARALAKKAKLLILDEPTAALTEHESLRLFERMRLLKARGVSIIFVSHRLAEVFAVCDRVVVMRDGRIRGRHDVTQITREGVVAEMIGSVDAPTKEAAKHELGPVALEVKDLYAYDAARRPVVETLDFAARRGEVLGLFGMLGSGFIEALLAVYGAWRGEHGGTVLIDGIERTIDGPEAAVALGLGLLAQDRRDCLIGDQSIADNISLASLASYSQHGFLDIATGKRRAANQLRQLHIKANSIETLVGTLSGGNQQKVQVARWLAAQSHILLMIDPTRGVDVGARREIKDIWSRLSADGRTIVLASSDAEELVDTCHRVIVMRHGRRAGELAGKQLNEGNLLRMASDG